LLLLTAGPVLAVTTAAGAGFADADFAVAAGVDSVAVPPRPDSSLTRVPPAATADSARSDTTRAGRGGVTRSAVPPPGRFDAPAWVMMRSLVVPGWGQAHNGAWIKAGVIATTEGLLIATVINKSDDLSALDAQVKAARAAGDIEGENQAVLAYNNQLASLTASEWWLGAAVAYSLLDAYIDAHFRGFDIEFKNDPALPGGAPPRGGRVGLRWNW
jgi:hypothetical protein